MKRSVVVLSFFVLLAVPMLLAAERPETESYAPGLGEFMTMTQVRHAKLWFAGEEKNWSLANYEIDEIKEGLEDASKLHPIHDGFPVADMIKAATEAPLELLSKSVEAKSRADFTTAFDKLTAGCNTCHAGVKHAFIEIKRPTAPPLSNQAFITSGN
ncbi:hypothetical protein [Hyphomicrobium sp.]|uniref:hypothetical protein n=1 Tax=Hyphomicrobium sp. TaxID=82 RepID=UPI002E346C9C|nr:hypothetical protein [Hyphomicrobium sp.]HEX2843086.1 hypothetical protein [Hyphomicrobium sp.]